MDINVASSSVIVTVSRTAGRATFWIKVPDNFIGNFFWVAIIDNETGIESASSVSGCFADSYLKQGSLCLYHDPFLSKAIGVSLTGVYALAR
jgi:hypothetical protein